MSYTAKGKSKIIEPVTETIILSSEAAPQKLDIRGYPPLLL